MTKLFVEAVCFAGVVGCRRSLFCLLTHARGCVCSLDLHNVLTYLNMRTLNIIYNRC